MSKKIGIMVTTFVGLMMLFTTSVMAYGDIGNIPSSVRNMLEYDKVFTDVARSIGYWLYKLLGFFTGMCEEGFNMLANYDIMKLDVVASVKTNIDVVLYSVLFIGFIVVVLLRMFKLENQFKTLFDVVLTMMFIALFVGVLGIMTNVKGALINEVNGIVEKNKNETMAETLYKTDTVDLLKSIKANKLIYLKDIDGLNLDYHDSTIRIKRADLNEKIIGVNDDGTFEIEKLQDGAFGAGDVRYYRYKTDYFALNITLAISVIIYALAIFKMSYLLYQWLQINIFGTFAMGQGFMDFKKVSETYKSALITLVGEVILYFSMMLFSVLSNSIMLDGALNGNWLLQAIFIFAIGMGVVTGTGFLNDKLGIDDGSDFALKSVFMAHRLSKMITTPIKTGAKVINKTGDMIDKGYKTIKNSGHSSHEENEKNDFNNVNSSKTENNDSENSNHKESMNNLNKNDVQANKKSKEYNGENSSHKESMNNLNKNDVQANKKSKEYNGENSSHKESMNNLNKNDVKANKKSNEGKKESEPSWKKSMDQINERRNEDIETSTNNIKKDTDKEEPKWKQEHENFRDNHKQENEGYSKNYKNNKMNDNQINEYEGDKKVNANKEVMEYTGIKNQRNKTRMNMVNRKSNKKSKEYDEGVEIVTLKKKKKSVDESYKDDMEERKQRRGVKNVNHTKEK